jgi:hypothetical protein
VRLATPAERTPSALKVTRQCAGFRVLTAKAFDPPGGVLGYVKESDTRRYHNEAGRLGRVSTFYATIRVGLSTEFSVFVHIQLPVVHE